MTLDEFKGALPPDYTGLAILAKYDGACGICDAAVLVGDPVLYRSADKCVVCTGCALFEDA